MQRADRRLSTDVTNCGSEPKLRVLELFAGIGGFRCAMDSLCAGIGLHESVAIDIDQRASDVYRRNYAGRYLVGEIESLSVEQLRQLPGDLWWLSPPCQPYSRRGHQRDVEDPRAQSLLHLIQLIDRVRPARLALENVVGFAESQAYAYLGSQLRRAGYHLAERKLCPTEMGWPNRRPRFYLLAALERLPPWRPLPRYNVSLAQLLSVHEPDGQPASLASGNDPARYAGLWLDTALARRYSSGLDRVEVDDPRALTACFGSSYGKSLLHAGSYLQEESGLRRFHPREVARLLGFPDSFEIPLWLSYRQAWKLLGNSLSIPAVRYVLSHLAGDSGG